MVLEMGVEAAMVMILFCPSLLYCLSSDSSNDHICVDRWRILLMEVLKGMKMDKKSTFADRYVFNVSDTIRLRNCNSKHPKSAKATRRGAQPELYQHVPSTNPASGSLSRECTWSTWSGPVPYRRPPMTIINCKSKSRLQDTNG